MSRLDPPMDHYGIWIDPKDGPLQRCPRCDVPRTPTYDGIVRHDAECVPLRARFARDVTPPEPRRLTEPLSRDPR